MAELFETAPFAGLNLPLAMGTCRISALPMGPIASVAPYPGRAAEVAARLGGFPAPGQMLATPWGRLAWAGRETAFLFGAAPDLAGLAAVSDQSDGWAGLRLEGQDAAEVLARLVPLDLAAMPPGSSARSVLNHLPLWLIHPEAEVFDLWSFRSMAGTLRHELAEAAAGVAARRDRR